jgi:hypothetical protein
MDPKEGENGEGWKQSTLPVVGSRFPASFTRVRVNDLLVDILAERVDLLVMDRNSGFC